MVPCLHVQMYCYFDKVFFAYYFLLSFYCIANFKSMATRLTISPGFWGEFTYQDSEPPKQALLTFFFCDYFSSSQFCKQNLFHLLTRTKKNKSITNLFKFYDLRSSMEQDGDSGSIEFLLFQLLCSSIRNAVYKA